MPHWETLDVAYSEEIAHKKLKRYRTMAPGRKYRVVKFGPGLITKMYCTMFSFTTANQD